MNTLPTEEGWSVWAAEGGSAEIITVADGTYNDSDVLEIKGNSYYEFFAPNDWKNNVNQNHYKWWWVETRMRVLANEQGSGDPFIWINEADQLSIFSFFEDGVKFTYPETTDLISFDTSDWLTYYLMGSIFDNKVYLQVEKEGTLLIDDWFIYEPSWPGSGTPGLIFGNGGGNSYQRTQWDYFTYSIPEPSSIFLMGTGLIGIVSLKRHRKNTHKYQ
jgi:hypothetical protein